MFLLSQNVLILCQLEQNRGGMEPSVSIVLKEPGMCEGWGGFELTSLTRPMHPGGLVQGVGNNFVGERTRHAMTADPMVTSPPTPFFLYCSAAYPVAGVYYDFNDEIWLFETLASVFGSVDSRSVYFGRLLSGSQTRITGSKR